MAGGVTIRRADLGRDGPLLVDMVRCHLNPIADAARFEWLYRGNPDGEARAWVATDRATRAVAGMAAAFPRVLWVSGTECRAWVLGEFCVLPEYRSVGPALALQRACLTDARLAGVVACYDFPSESMMTLYRRLGEGQCRRMLRLAKPLRVDRRVEAVVGAPRLARGISVIGNLVLRARIRPRSASSTVTVELRRDRCDEEFSRLSREVGARPGVRVRRSMQYLNWRFLGDPRGLHEVLAARRAGTLVGYAVLTQHGRDGILVDLFGREDAEVAETLVDAAVSLFRSRGAVTVSASLIESHPWVPCLRRRGFVPRESTPVVFVPFGSPFGNGHGPDGLDWILVHGDRDS